MCVVVYVYNTPLPRRSLTAARRHHRLRRIVEIPERKAEFLQGRHPSSRHLLLDRTRAVAAATAATTVPPALPPVRHRHRHRAPAAAAAAAAIGSGGGWATEKLTPWVKFRSRGFCVRV